MNGQELTPFGNPDGSRAALDDILSGFVQFGGHAAWGGLATEEDDLRARIIVGRKGSGKTVYLRRLHAYTTKNAELYYTDPIQHDLPATDMVVKFSQWFPDSVLTEKWMLVWRRAIVRSVVSHVINDTKLSAKIPKNFLDLLTSSFTDLFRSFKTPVSVYSQVQELIRAGMSSHHVTQLLENPKWAELEHVFGECIHGLPPLFFYVDAVDEEYAHAPMYWLRCQKGLFYTTMRLLREARLGSRLHIIIGIRDTVLSSALRSEHQTRYFGEEHIRILNWNRTAIKHFLEERVKKLSEAFFVLNPNTEGKSTKSWLGIATILNTARGVEEDICDYLLRHTRLLPRDIVILGNMLCQEIAKGKARGEAMLTEDAIRTTVSKVARAFGNEQLAICGNQLLSDSMPAKAALYGYADSYTFTGSAEYTHTMGDEIKKVITLINKDRFSKSDLVAAIQLARDKISNPDNLFEVLWQNGLVGYVEESAAGERAVYYSEELIDQFTLPDREEYVFHSCLIDCAGIKPIGLPGGLLTTSRNKQSMIQAKAILRPLKVFISYSHKDAQFRDELEAHLKLLQRQGEISTWSDRLIPVGTKWGAQIDSNLENAEIVLFLISADFIASDYCYDIEMKRTLARVEAKESRMVPIIVRDCDWRNSPVSQFQACPAGARPVAQWRLRDSAWKSVVDEIRKAIADVRKFAK